MHLSVKNKKTAMNNLPIRIAATDSVGIVRILDYTRFLYLLLATVLKQIV